MHAPTDSLTRTSFTPRQAGRRRLMVAVSVSLALHLLVLVGGVADGLLNWLFNRGLEAEAAATPQPEQTVEITFDPIDPELLAALDEPTEVDDPIDTPNVKRKPVQLPNGTFVFGPDHRPEATESPENPRLFSDRDMAARNDTEEDLPEGEAYSEGDTEHDVLQVEPEGEPVPPGLVPSPAPPEHVPPARVADNDEGELAAEHDRKQSGEQVEQDVKRQQEDAREQHLGAADASDVALAETEGERVVKEYGHEETKDGRVGEEPNLGRRQEPGVAEDPELELIRKATDLAMRQPVPAGGQPGVREVDWSLYRNTSSKSSSKGNDELDAANHPLGPYMRQLSEDIGPRWRTLVRSARTLSGLPMVVAVRFSIDRQGRLVASEVIEVKTGNKDDSDAQTGAEKAICLKAIRDAKPFEPLPEWYELEELQVTFAFIFN